MTIIQGKAEFTAWSWKNVGYLTMAFETNDNIKPEWRAV